MRKKYIFRISLIFLLCMLSACSKGVGGKSKPEYEEINSAFIENVQAPLEELILTLDEIEIEFINESISEEEAIDKHSKEVNSFIKEKSEFIKNYPKLKTKEGENYFDMIVSGYDISFEALTIVDEYFDKNITNTLDDKHIEEIETTFEPMENELNEILEQLEDVHEQVFVDYDIDLERIYFLE
ncbi:hypothetical protein ACFSKI_15330 [Pseudogracilibacillus auburnensis]|uniref:Cell-wall binding lipoprotein n=1 Tax=Pseudogracilibacillus auburnensis TaxID=1494959 RepID=A0A2V3VNU3_9BACI|nr:hypothetical protein [Pseudogracilibacillus auburnensis]PXW82488.1 hypothetical protein DFR56_11864 [Pseudogracilibacillus auburnensis]